MAPARKSTVFRVTGLATTTPDDVLDADLKAAVRSNLTEEEKSAIQFAIAILPSCYDEERERVALVEFRGGVPKFLSELVAHPLEDWQIEMKDMDINFDSHFFGFTQLYAPKPDVPITADVITITGIDGHAYGSWRGKGNLGRMWLRDFLSKDLPNCRTMIYGYNSKLSSHGVGRIMDYGRELMEEMKKIRNGMDSRRRPLFFIVHSFGGIMLAHCLIKAVQTNEDDHPTIASLHRATYGILFFATPHKGLLTDDIEKMLGQVNHSREVLLQQIRHNSDLLIAQLVDFKNLIRDRKIVSFYETEQTRQLELDSESGRWRRTGDFLTTVDTDSALLQLPDNMEDKIPLHSDHSMIVKFDNQNAQGYRSALGKLKQFEQDAPRVVAARFSPVQNRLTPSSNLPFQRDSQFVGRKDIIAKIREWHEQINSQSHSRIALVGLGGVGKSQIAIEYAYRFIESSPMIWVFWVHASNAVRFEQAYRDIAIKVELPGRDDPNANIMRLVYNWLCDERNGRWLMILDNADDDDVFFGSGADLQTNGQASSAFDGRMPLASFLPQTPNGWILVTSRNLLAAKNLIGMQHNVIRVEPMGEEDALLLLHAGLLVRNSSEREERALVQALEFIPLAIAQAAAYIRAREPRIKLSNYLQIFHESEADKLHLLQNEETRDLRRDLIARNAIITTWYISFEQIGRMRPAATDLLSLMSMFDRQGIPEELLHDGTNKLHFEDALAPLISFSLVKTQVGQQTEKQSFEMHRLVQLSTRQWLECNQQLKRWRKESIRSVALKFPNGEYETWAACQLLLPHSKMVLRYLSSDEDNDEKLNHAEIAYNMSCYLYHRGEYTAAEKVSRVSVEGRGKVLGRDHLDTLNSSNLLGMVLTGLYKYEEAETVHQRCLKRRKKLLGHEHPETLDSLSNLALILHKLGKYEKAEAMHRQCIKTKEKVLGHEHPKTLFMLNNLGLVLEDLGKYEEAETMLRQCIKTSEKVLGHEHPDTLIMLNNLGSVLQNLGKYEKAETMLRQCIKTSEKVLGHEHPDTLTSLHTLGSVLEDLGKYEKAEAMHRQCIKTKEKVLGHEHSDTLTSLLNLGSVLENLGKYEEAETMLWKCIKTREKVLGYEHPDTLVSVDFLAHLHHNQKHYDDALDLYLRALSGYKKVLGMKHPRTIRCDEDYYQLLREMAQDEGQDVGHDERQDEEQDEWRDEGRDEGQEEEQDEGQDEWQDEEQDERHYRQMTQGSMLGRVWKWGRRGGDKWRRKVGI